ncbi:hypothetical protein PIB30_060948 [Stylosanthes scabra]|uniref:EF-hand domain-containing protein n=1 Tax=Stylosanthes scabra TaxID=79078 RepID=A0ABU6YK39_9FABA|nr:hypothetical protein [Stylosanthes scabra]
MVFEQILYLFEDKTSSSSSSQSDGNSNSPLLFGFEILSGFWWFLLSQLQFSTSSSSEPDEIRTHHKTESSSSRDNNNNEKKNLVIKKDEAKMVMAKLGLFSTPEESGDDEELEEQYGCKEFSSIFEEQEPSLDEVKQAFEVFDENKDGFIDAMELQRVLCLLGLKEARDIKNCEKMIRKFDENKDGRIDFNEFVKIMENRFHC